eukprot:SAG11_NODE_18_length_25850_cov_18.210050_15_plen_107_part_00
MMTRSRKADLLLAQDLEQAAAPEAEGDTPATSTHPLKITRAVRDYRAPALHGFFLLRITHDTDSARAARARGYMDFSISRFYSGRKIRLKGKLDLCERPVEIGIKD